MNLVVSQVILPAVSSAAVAVVGAAVAGAVIAGKRWLESHGLLQKVQAGVAVAKAAGITEKPVEGAVASFLSTWLTAHGHPVSAKALEGAWDSVQAAASQDEARASAPTTPVAPVPPPSPAPVAPAPPAG